MRWFMLLGWRRGIVIKFRGEVQILYRACLSPSLKMRYIYFAWEAFAGDACAAFNIAIWLVTNFEQVVAELGASMDNAVSALILAS